jgi:hypothetical protein
MALETYPVQCPYCGEAIEVDIEPMEEAQRFIEDCAVCCHPIQYETTTDSEGEVHVTASRSD